MRKIINYMGIGIIISLFLFTHIISGKSLTVKVPADGLQLRYEGTYNSIPSTSEVEFNLISGDNYKVSTIMSGGLNMESYWEVDESTRIITKTYSPQGYALLNYTHEYLFIPTNIGLGDGLLLSYAGYGDVGMIVTESVSITAMGKSIECWHLTNSSWPGLEYWNDKESGLLVKFIMPINNLQMTIAEIIQPEKDDDKNGDSSLSIFTIDGYSNVFFIAITIALLILYKKSNRKSSLT